jgi:hypothetical protein
MVIDIFTLRKILDTHVPDFTAQIIEDLQRHSDATPVIDPPPREMTLEEEIARMTGEGCPNGD